MGHRKEKLVGGPYRALASRGDRRNECDDDERFTRGISLVVVGLSLARLSSAFRGGLFDLDVPLSTLALVIGLHRMRA